MSRRHWLMAGVGVCLLGCVNRPAKPKPEPISLLQKPKSSENSIAIEFARVLVPLYRRRILSELWDQVDQQTIAVNVRKRLVRNGMRVGIAGAALPAPLRSLLQPLPVAEDQLDPLQHQMFEKGLMKPAAVVVGHTRLSLKYHSPRQQEVNGPLDAVHWVWQSDHGRSHHRFADARAQLRLTAHPHVSRAVHLGVEPLIAHGPLVPQFQAALQQDGFSPGVAQQENLLPDAAFQTPLKLGETLLFGPGFLPPDAQAHRRMGEVFFRNPGSPPGDWLVLLRLIETNDSDLFGGAESSPNAPSAANS
jgi:hypothetical protein